MTTQMQTMVNCEVIAEMVSLLNAAMQLPRENRERFFEFWRGVSYGLDMAGALSEQAQTASRGA